MPVQSEDDAYFDRIGAKASGAPRRGENLCLGCYERAAEITLLKEQIALTGEALPDSWYTDRKLWQRVLMLVQQWRRLHVVLKDMNAEEMDASSFGEPPTEEEFLRFKDQIKRYGQWTLDQMMNRLDEQAAQIAALEACTQNRPAVSERSEPDDYRIFPYDPLEGIEDELSKLDLNKIYVENVRSLLNISSKRAEHICELAVRNGLMSKFVEVLCPNGGAAISAPSNSELPSAVECWEEEDGEYLLKNYPTQTLRKLTYYTYNG